MMTSLVRQKMGGTEVYASQLVNHFAQLEDPRLNFILVYADDGQDRSQGVLLSSDSPTVQEYTLRNFKVGTSHLRKLFQWLFLSMRRKTIWREIESAAGSKVDVAFYPFTAIYPQPLRRIKTVTVIHDLQHKELPEAFSRGQLLYRHLTYERPAKKAEAVITVSDFTKQTIIEYLNIPQSKIHRIYPGLRPLEIEGSSNQQSQSNPTEKFLYYPARGLSHKNHKNLFLAFEKVRKTYPDLLLKLSGSDAEFLGTLPENVVHLGNLDSQEILQNYQNCHAVVFPSLYEGFGFPALEALGTQSLLVASDVGSIPEVVSDFAILIDPRDVDSIAAGIMTAMDMPHTAVEADEWVRQFTWEQTAANTIAVLCEVAASES